MTESAVISFDERRFNALKEARERVSLTETEFNRHNEAAKSAKKIFEAARDTFEREFDRLVSGESDLPLFDNQSDAIAKAEADPVVTKLADRLISLGHDVNLLIVAGYTEEERTQAAAYCDARDNRKELEAAGAEQLPDVEVPAFLVPQVLTAIEVADLLVRLVAAGHELDAPTIEALTPPERADVRDWLGKVEAITAEKGEALVADDLPAAPEWLQARADDVAITKSEAEDAADMAAEETAAEDDQSSAIVCAICGGPDATETTKPLNGLPRGVLACDDCRAAVKRREVGVTREEDGTLRVTDGRRPVQEPTGSDEVRA